MSAAKWTDAPVKSPPHGRLRCPACDADALDLGDGKGPHPASVVCRACGHHVKCIGLPITPASAARFAMPFGSHKGRPMGELPTSYLRWMAENIEGRIGERARVLLADGGPQP